MDPRKIIGRLVLVCACAVSVNSVAQEDLLTQTQDESSGQSPNALTPEQDRQQQIQKRFFAELDVLIPGDFAPDSPQKKGVEKAVAAFRQGDMPEANRQFEKLAQADPSFPPVGLLQAGLVFAAGNSTQGFQILEDAALKNPDYPGIYFAFARLAIGQKRYTDALALLDKAVLKMKLKPLSERDEVHFKSRYYDAMVDILMRQKKYDLARTNLEKLENVSPDANKVPITKAELDFLDGNYDSSFARLKAFNEKNPESNLPEIVMAKWFQDTGKVDEAGVWIIKAAESYPDNPMVQFQYATYAINKDAFTEANVAIETIESKLGETPPTVLLKGQMAFAGQTYELAEAHYKKLIELQPNSFDAANMYALSLIESPAEDKRKLAAQIAQRNLQALPDNQIAQAAFGWVLWRLGEKEQARTFLTRAARSPQLAPEIAFFLATIMHESGSSQQAKLVLEQAINAKGLFLYRNAATKLMQEIDEKTTGSLPDPNK